MYTRAPTVVMSMKQESLAFSDHVHDMPVNGGYSGDELSMENGYEALGASHDHGEEKLAVGGQHESRANLPLQALPEGQHRVQLACLRCRKQKLKCDGGTPACSRCLNRNAECVYSSEPTGRKNGSKKKNGRRGGRKEESVSNALTLTTKARGTDLGIPSERPPPQLVALEQLSRKLKVELDSYSTMAKHWQEQLGLLKKGGPSAVTDKQAVAWLRREMRPKMPKEKSGRPRYLPESRTLGEPWTSYTSESHPAIHLAQSMVAFGDRALVANPIQTMQDPSQVDLRCHRFRLMRFWDMSSPRELLTDDLNYETLVAAWDILLQPISTIIQGNAFVDEVGRHLEDDLEERRSLDSIAIFAHTAELEEVLTVMEFGVLFFHATQLVGWDQQMEHLITNVDRLLQVAFFQRGLSAISELADRTINFVTWYVWRFKAFKMTSAYTSLLNIGYQTLLSNFSYVSPSIAAGINTLLITMASTHAQMMHHVHLAERIEHTPLKKALLGLAIAIVTLNHADSPVHQYEKLESDYPELLRVIDSIENPFDPGNHAIAATALFLHAEVLVRLGRDIRVVEELLDSAIQDVVQTEACNAIHLLFSNMFMFQATVNTVVQFTSGITCTVSDYARIELAKALGFPLSSCSNLHNNADHSDSPCKLKFGQEFQQAFSRMGQFQPCDGQCEPTASCGSGACSSEACSSDVCSSEACASEVCASEVVTPNSEAHTHHHYVSPGNESSSHNITSPSSITSSASLLGSSSSTSMLDSNSLSASSSHYHYSNAHTETSPGWSSTSSPFVASPAFATPPTPLQQEQRDEPDSISASSTSYFPEEFPSSDPISLHLSSTTTTTMTTTTFQTHPALAALSDSGVFFNDTAQHLDAHPTFSLSMSGDQLPPWNAAPNFHGEF